MSRSGSGMKLVVMLAETMFSSISDGFNSPFEALSANSLAARVISQREE